MPSTKITEQASSKLLHAVELVQQAEQAIREVTPDDLVREGYAVADESEVRRVGGKAITPLAANAIYEVHAYATTLRIIRKSLFGDYLC